MSEEKKYVFHCLVNPYVPTLASSTACAFTMYARRFSKMMAQRGYTVYFYGTGRDDSLICTEYIDIYGEDYNSATYLVVSDWNKKQMENCTNILYLNIKTLDILVI